MQIVLLTTILAKGKDPPNDTSNTNNTDITSLYLTKQPKRSEKSNTLERLCSNLALKQ